MFVFKEYFDPVERKQKLSPVADRPYPVVFVTDDTVVIESKGKHDRVSRDRVLKFKEPLRKAGDVEIHDDYAKKFVPYLNEGTKSQRRSKKRLLRPLRNWLRSQRLLRWLNWHDWLVLVLNGRLRHLLLRSQRLLRWLNWHDWLVLLLNSRLWHLLGHMSRVRHLCLLYTSPSPRDA